jgi:hypothetical protein
MMLAQSDTEDSDGDDMSDDSERIRQSKAQAFNQMPTTDMQTPAQQQASASSSLLSRFKADPGGSGASSRQPKSKKNTSEEFELKIGDYEKFLRTDPSALQPAQRKWMKDTIELKERRFVSVDERNWLDKNQEVASKLAGELKKSAGLIDEYSRKAQESRQRQQQSSSDRKDEGPAAPANKDVADLAQKIARDLEKDEAEGRPQKIRRTGREKAVGMRRGREDIEAEARESAKQIVDQQLSEQAEALKALIELMQKTEMEIKDGAAQIATDTKDIPKPTLAVLRKLSTKLTDDLKTMKAAREAADAAASKAQGEARALQAKLSQSESTSNDAINRVNGRNEELVRDIEVLKATQLTLQADLQRDYKAELERINAGHATIVQGLRDSLEKERKTNSGLQTQASKAEAAVTVLDSVQGQLTGALERNKQLDADLARAADEQRRLQREHDQKMSDLRAKFNQDFDKEAKDLATERKRAEDNRQEAEVAMREVASLKVALEAKSRALSVKDVPPMTFYAAFRLLLEKGSAGLSDVRYPLGLDASKTREDFAQLLKQFTDSISAGFKEESTRLQRDIDQARAEVKDIKEQAERSAAKQKTVYEQSIGEQGTIIKTLREQKLDLDNLLAAASDSKVIANATIESFKQTQAVLEQRVKAAELKSISAREELIRAQGELSATRTKLDGLSVGATETEAIRQRLDAQLQSAIQQSETTGHKLALALAEIERLKTEIVTLTGQIKSRDKAIGELSASNGALTAAVSRQSTAAANRQDADTKQTGSILDQTQSLIEQAEQIARMIEKLRLLQDDYNGFVALTATAVKAIDKVKWKAMYPNPFHPYQPPIRIAFPAKLVHLVFAACSDKVFGDMLADALGDNYTPWIPLHAHVTAVLSLAESEQDMKYSNDARRVMLTVFSILAAYHVVEERVQAHMRSPASDVQPLGPLTAQELRSLSGVWYRITVDDVIKGVIYGCMHAAAHRARVYGDRLTNAIGNPSLFPSLSSSVVQKTGDMSKVLQERLQEEEFCRALVKRIRNNHQLQLFWRYDGNPMDIIQSMLVLPGMSDEIQAAAGPGQRR